MDIWGSKVTKTTYKIYLFCCHSGNIQIHILDAIVKFLLGVEIVPIVLLKKFLFPILGLENTIIVVDLKSAIVNKIQMNKLEES